MTKVSKVNDEIELYIDPVSLIRAVKERPVLYTLTRNASLRAKRNLAWSEIGADIIPNWTQLSTSEQDLCEVELQKKWNNLKDSYIKAYKKQKHYIYYSALTFLEPIITQKIGIKSEQFDNMEENIETLEESEQIESGAEYLSDSKKSSEYNETGNNNKRKRSRIKKPMKFKNEEESEVKIIPNKKPKINKCINDLLATIDKQNKFDADEMFLLSLHPYLNQLTEEKKIQTQIDILTLIKQRTEDQEFE